jgi:hypothetical protein
MFCTEHADCDACWLWIACVDDVDDDDCVCGIPEMFGHCSNGIAVLAVRNVMRGCGLLGVGGVLVVVAVVVAAVLTGKDELCRLLEFVLRMNRLQSEVLTSPSPAIEDCWPGSGRLSRALTIKVQSPVTQAKKKRCALLE